MTVLETRDLKAFYGDFQALFGVDVTLDAGETIATSGASGGQKAAGLYFELRAKGQAVDPRAWLR